MALQYAVSSKVHSSRISGVTLATPEGSKIFFDITQMKLSM
jgi:hypothetical protein